MIKQIKHDVSKETWRKICPHWWGGYRHMLEINPLVTIYVLDCWKCRQRVTNGPFRETRNKILGKAEELDDWKESGT